MLSTSTSWTRSTTGSSCGPLQWFARTVLWKTIDQWLVDRVAVMGSARLLQGFGWLGSRLQTGQVGLYLLLFVAGAVWVLGVVLQ